ncbi:MAG: hypothetical protein SNJ74_05975 [Fimbriimonadaceae bacterium]
MATLTLADIGGGQVGATMQHFGLGVIGNDPGRFVGTLRLNVGDSSTDLGAINLGLTDANPIGRMSLAQVSKDGVNGPQSLRFDAEVDFANNPPRLSAGATYTWTFTGNGLTASLFDNAAPNSDVRALIHLQGLDPQLAGFSTNQTSLWLTATNTPTLVGDPVPEPFTMGLVAVGALAAARRTRAKRKA